MASSLFPVVAHRRYDRIRPTLEAMPVAGRHAEHLGDDRRGQGLRVAADQVHAAVPRDGVEQFVGQGLDPIAHFLDELRRERLMHQAPQPGMIGRVNVEHVSRQRPDEFRHPGLAGGLLGGPHPPSFLGESIVLEDCGHVVVAGDEPGDLLVRQRRAIDRGFGAQAGVEGIRVGLEPGADDVDAIDSGHETSPESWRSVHQFFASSDRINPPASR